MSAYTWLPGLGTEGSYSGGPSTTYLYVATTGDDGNPGTEQRPFASIGRANDVIAASGIAAGASVTVYVGPGYYWNTDVTFEPASSAGATYVVKYVSTGGPGQAVLCGGSVIAPGSWSLVSGSIYRVAIAAPVYTMWENGTRGRQARLPKWAPGASYPCAFAPYFTAAGVADSATVLQYDPGDFDPASWALADIHVTAWSRVLTAPTDWFSDTHGVTARDTGTKRLTLDNSGLKFFAKSGTYGARYFVHGVLDILTEAGEFVCHQDAGQWYLYYWARDGAIASQEIVVPTTKRVLSFIGTDETTRTKNITLEGLGIAYSEFDSWYRYGTDGLGPDPYDYFYTQAEFQQGAVYMENVDNIELQSCHVKNSGQAGVFLQGYVQDCTIENTWIEYTGTDGISANGLGPGDGDVLKNNTITNVKINNMGQLDGSAAGLRLSQSSGNDFSHLDISQGPRRAIWIQGAFDVVQAQNYAYGNTGSYIAVSDVMQDSGDAGAITMSFLSAPIGTPPRTPVNSLDQVSIDGANAHPSMLDSVPNGVFFDNHAGGQETANILVENTQGNFLRVNDNDGPDATNCAWQVGFNPALISPDIGLTDEWPF